MQYKAIVNVLGILLVIYSFTLLIPVPVSFYFHDSDYMPFVIGFAATFVMGLILWGVSYKHRAELKVRDGFLIVVLFWCVLSVFGALPLWLGDHHPLSFTNALFESVSGFTTTGTSAIPDLRTLSASLLYYRQQLQFFGGMGIIVLAVAILPMLGVGGMQLYRAEIPGPMKEDKITPRITETAKNIWLIYVGLAVMCSVAYWLAGMTAFDALEESFSTISTGGFSTHNASFAYYHSNVIELIGVVFMFLGGVNFTLHYLAVTRSSIRSYWQDIEFRAFLFIIISAAIVTVVLLYVFGVYQSMGVDVIQGLFTVVSMATTSGFAASAYAQWPLFIPFLLMLLGLLGACGGSTGGGFKVVRAIVLRKQLSKEVHRLIHPQGVSSLKFGNRLLSKNIIDAVWAFATAYVALIFISIVLIMATGVNLESAYGVVAESLSNAGIGIGQYAYSAVGLNDFSKWVMMFDMITGRLEVFTVLVLLSRSFWRN